MNCANHADVPATAYCRTCGKPLCSTCARDVRGVIYCEECLASHLSGTMPPPGPSAVPPGAQPATGVPSPGLAAILGFIPGVGAMYNGEFAKGFVHVVIFATLIWMADNVSGLFGLAIAAFVIYMPIEAYKTARAKEMGLPAPDPFGFNNLFSPGGSAKPASRRGCHRCSGGRRQPSRTSGGPACGCGMLPAIEGAHWRFYPDRTGRVVPARRNWSVALPQSLAFLAAGADCSRDSRPDAQNRKGLVRRTS